MKNIINMQDFVMKRQDSRLGRTTGKVYFCDSEGEPLWTDKIWKDDNGWHISKGQHLLTFCTETFNECPNVKVIKLVMPSQNRTIYLGCKDGSAVPTHIETIFPDAAEGIFRSNQTPNPTGLHTDELSKGTLGVK